MSQKETEGERLETGRGLPPLTIGRILSDLQPGQLWSAVTAVVSIVVAAFAAGYKVAAMQAPAQVSGAPTQASGLVPCKDVEGWPAGTWVTWGRISDWRPEKWRDREFPQVVPEVQILSKSAGTVNPQQRSSSSGLGIKREVRVVFEPQLEPGKPFRAIARDGTPDYQALTNGSVTSDGCRIEGSFSDTNGTLGSVRYLFKRDRYYVDR